MGIELTTPQSYLDDILKQVTEIIAFELKRSLAYLGEKCIKKIRDRSSKASWIDQTGNLRSSIGYAVFENGRKDIESAFNIVLQGSQGAIVGKKLLDDLASAYSDTFALVVVAGMEYAEYVEAKNNKDVLSNTELWAKREIQRYLNIAKSRSEKRINKLLQ